MSEESEERLTNEIYVVVIPVLHRAAGTESTVKLIDGRELRLVRIDKMDEYVEEIFKTILEGGSLDQLSRWPLSIVEIEGGYRRIKGRWTPFLEANVLTKPQSSECTCFFYQKIGQPRGLDEILLKIEQKLKKRFNIGLYSVEELKKIKKMPGIVAYNFIASFQPVYFASIPTGDIVYDFHLLCLVIEKSVSRKPPKVRIRPNLIVRNMIIATHKLVEETDCPGVIIAGREPRISDTFFIKFKRHSQHAIGFGDLKLNFILEGYYNVHNEKKSNEEIRLVFVDMYTFPFMIRLWSKNLSKFFMYLLIDYIRYTKTAKETLDFTSALAYIISSAILRFRQENLPIFLIDKLDRLKSRNVFFLNFLVPFLALLYQLRVDVDTTKKLLETIKNLIVSRIHETGPNEEIPKIEEFFKKLKNKVGREDIIDYFEKLYTLFAIWLVRVFVKPQEAYDIGKFYGYVEEILGSENREFIDYAFSLLRFLQELITYIEGTQIISPTKRYRLPLKIDEITGKLAFEIDEESLDRDPFYDRQFVLKEKLMLEVKRNGTEYRTLECYALLFVKIIELLPRDDTSRILKYFYGYSAEKEKSEKIDVVTLIRRFQLQTGEVFTRIIPKPQHRKEGRHYAIRMIGVKIGGNGCEEESIDELMFKTIDKIYVSEIMSELEELSASQHTEEEQIDDATKGGSEQPRWIERRHISEIYKWLIRVLRDRIEKLEKALNGASVSIVALLHPSS